MKSKIENSPLYIKQFPSELKEDVKILCFAAGASLQDKIIQLISEYVNKNKAKLDRIKKDMK